MSDAPRSGIGGLLPPERAWAEDEGDAAGVDLPNSFQQTEAIEPARAAPAAPASGQTVADSLAQAHALIGELRSANALLFEKYNELVGAVQQLQGQAVQIETYLPKVNTAIGTLDARVTEIGRQVARNMRLAVLEIVAKARQPGDPASSLRKMAEEFLSFAEPAQTPAPASAANGLDDDIPPRTIAH